MSKKPISTSNWSLVLFLFCLSACSGGGGGTIDPTANTQEVPQLKTALERMAEEQNLSLDNLQQIATTNEFDSENPEPNSVEYVEAFLNFFVDIYSDEFKHNISEVADNVRIAFDSGQPKTETELTEKIKIAIQDQLIFHDLLSEIASYFEINFGYQVLNENYEIQEFLLTSKSDYEQAFEIEYAESFDNLNLVGDGSSDVVKLSLVGARILLLPNDRVYFLDYEMPASFGMNGGGAQAQGLEVFLVSLPFENGFVLAPGSN